ncbi:MAG: hypothetical protein ACP5K9_00770 [Candidatus Micrarchaeia archaeon]
MKAIGIDLDDTIADFTPVWLRVIEDTTGVKINYSDIKMWHVENQFKFLDKNAIISALKVAWDERHSEIEIIDRHIPSIIDNISQFYKIYITTASLASDSTIKEWLSLNGIRYNRLVHVAHHSEKMMEEVYAYVDDNPMMAEEFTSAGKKVVLIRRPWNEGTKEKENLLIADNWDEVEHLLVNLADRRPDE